MSKGAEALYRALSDIDDKYIQEAEQKKANRRSRSMLVPLVLAACLALVLCATSYTLFSLFHGASSAAPDHAVPNSGPILPLTLVDENSWIVCTRCVSFDFADWQQKNAVHVTDRYVLTNTSASSQTLLLNYPYTQHQDRFAETAPMLSVNGKTIEAKVVQQSYLTTPTSTNSGTGAPTEESGFSEGGGIADLQIQINMLEYFLEAELTIPAGQSITLCAEIDNCGITEKQARRSRFELTTKGKTNLNIQEQRATLLHTEHIHLVQNNFRFALHSGVTEVVLAPTREPYYLLVEPLED